MKEHAIESFETSNASANVSANTSGAAQNQPTTAASSSTTDQGNNSSILDNSDTMEELNRMISKFERLSRETDRRNRTTTSSPLSSSSPSTAPHRSGPPGSDRLRLNNAVRETFANRFAHMLLSFEHFVIFGGVGGGSERDSAVDMGEEEEDEDDDEDLAGMPHRRDTQQNFDKTSFLSDQKQSHLPFLSSFLETQTFSSFVDEFIISHESGAGGFVQTPFGFRLNKLKGKKTLNLRNTVVCIFVGGESMQQYTQVPV